MTIALIVSMVLCLAISYYGIGFYLDYRKWYVMYPNGKVSRHSRLKREAIKQAQSWDAPYVFCVVDIFGKRKKLIHKVLDKDKLT